LDILEISQATPKKDANNNNAEKQYKALEEFTGALERLQSGHGAADQLKRPLQ
jgi:hypothetical protein